MDFGDFQETYNIHILSDFYQPGPKVIKLFSCSTQLSMTIFLLVNVEMPTIGGI